MLATHNSKQYALLHKDVGLMLFTEFEESHNQLKLYGYFSFEV